MLRIPIVRTELPLVRTQLGSDDIYEVFFQFLPTFEVQKAELSSFQFGLTSHWIELGVNIGYEKCDVPNEIVIGDTEIPSRKGNLQGSFKTRTDTYADKQIFYIQEDSKRTYMFTTEHSLALLEIDENVKWRFAIMNLNLSILQKTLDVEGNTFDALVRQIFFKKIVTVEIFPFEE